MDNQKLENLLNLSLDASPTEREKSLVLDTGYNNTTALWTLIIKYINSFEPIRNISESSVELLGNYGIVQVLENRIDELSALPQVIYIEKPKPLYFAVANAKQVSCVSSIQSEPLNLYGEGCLIGVIDSGIDYKNSVFLNGDGTSRIYSIWDQTVAGTPPQGFYQGSYYDNADINSALSSNTPLPTADNSGHGTAVASIAAGNFSDDKSQNQGMATRSEIIAVKLGNPSPDSFPKTSELMQAIDFTIRESIKAGKPLAINLSFGNNYGSHAPYHLGKHFLCKFMSLYGIWTKRFGFEKHFYCPQYYFSVSESRFAVISSRRRIGGVAAIALA